jgi:hypothetical protein
VRVFIGLEILMPYVFYKGALLTYEEYERLKEELDKEEQEYLKLLLGEESGPQEGPDEAFSVEVPEASEETVKEPEGPVESVDNHEVHSKDQGGETGDSGESGVRRGRRKRQ